MDERIRKLLDNIPERQPRSRLEPHIDVIRELRRKRRSYTGNFQVLQRAFKHSGRPEYAL